MSQSPSMHSQTSCLSCSETWIVMDLMDRGNLAAELRHGNTFINKQTGALDMVSSCIICGVKLLMLCLLPKSLSSGMHLGCVLRGCALGRIQQCNSATFLSINLMWCVVQFLQQLLSYLCVFASQPYRQVCCVEQLMLLQLWLIFTAVMCVMVI